MTEKGEVCTAVEPITGEIPKVELSEYGAVERGEF